LFRTNFAVAMDRTDKSKGDAEFLTERFFWGGSMFKRNYRCTNLHS